MELLLEVCFLLVFSGTKMWSSEAPDYQAAGKKILLSDHCNINCASKKRNNTSSNLRRGCLKEEKEKCSSAACFKT